METPQTNGRVEMKYRHLLEVVRALHFQAHLPISFWGECINNKILNHKVPNCVLFGKISYEMLFQAPSKLTTCLSLDVML